MNTVQASHLNTSPLRQTDGGAARPESLAGRWKRRLVTWFREGGKVSSVRDSGISSSKILALQADAGTPSQACLGARKPGGSDPSAVRPEECFARDQRTLETVIETERIAVRPEHFEAHGSSSAKRPPGAPADGMEPSLDEEDAPQFNHNTLCARLPEPSRWSWSWSFFLLGSNRPLRSGTSGTDPAPQEKTSWTSRQAAALSSWWDAHFHFGLMSKGRGPHFDAIKEVLAEKAEFEAPFQKPAIRTRKASSETVPTKFSPRQTGPGKSGPIHISPQSELLRNELLAKHISPIHEDMLATLDHLEKLHDANPKHLRRRKSWFWNLFRFLRRAAKEDNFLEQIQTRAKDLFHSSGGYAAGPSAEVIEKLEHLIGKGVVLSLQSYDTSALVAQLAMDQTTLDRLAALPDTTNISAVNDILLKRQHSKIQQLRRNGFASMAQIDHIFRAISYLTRGMSIPKHKLNKVLADGGKINREDVAGSYAELIASLKEGQHITVGSGWSRGVRLEWIIVGLKKAGFFGATNYIGRDRSFDYTLTFMNVNGSIEVGLGRLEIEGVNVGASGWFGIGVGPEEVGFYAGGTVGVNLRKQWGVEDTISITLGKASPGLRANLELLLSGKISNPYEVLAMGEVSEAGHYKTKASSATASLTPDGLFSLSVNVSPNLKAKSEGQSFISPVYARLDAEIYSSSAREGGKFFTSSGAYQTENSHELYSLLTHRPKMRFTLGSSAMLRGRFGNSFSGTSLATAGRLHGPAATGEVGIGIHYQTERKTWREIFVGTPKAKFSVPEIHKPLKGGVGEITWTMTLPRAASALKAAPVKALLAGEQSETSDTLIDSISYTTRENREKIRGSLRALRETADSNNVSIDKELARMESLLDFLAYKDRANFRKSLSRIQGMMPEDNAIFKQELERLEELTGDANDSAWQRKSRSKEIVMNMKTSEQESLEFQSGSLDAEKIKNRGFGECVSVKTTETRMYWTSARMPVLFQLGSTASLTASSQTTWRVKPKD
ncbi:hypothetical protein [Roseibium aggregatum]|nr:hypothetical protein [Roseibium aggregatum]